MKSNYMSFKIILLYINVSCKTFAMGGLIQPLISQMLTHAKTNEHSHVLTDNSLMFSLSLILLELKIPYEFCGRKHKQCAHTHISKILR